MNRSTPRWLTQDPDGSAALTAAESVVLREVLEALRSVEFGSVDLIIQDRRVVQIDVTRKKRL